MINSISQVLSSLVMMAGAMIVGHFTGIQNGEEIGLGVAVFLSGFVDILKQRNEPR